MALSDAPGVYSIGFRDEIKAAAYERWYALDPAAAIRAEADSDLTPARKDSVVEALLEDWASKAPKEVKAFLQEGELPEVSADQVYGAVARGSSQQGDAEVVAFALEKIQDPRLHSYAVRSVARFLQNGYGEIFDEWVTALPREQQELAIAESAWILASKNIELALNGLDRLAEMGAENAPVTRARVVVQWAKEEPEMAGEWVMEQRLPAAERETLFGSVFRAWLSDDQSAAVAWADSLIAEGAIDEALMNRVLRN